MLIVDSHCHLDADAFDHDRNTVISRARDVGVTRQVVPATHAAGWPGLRGICAARDGLFAAYGLHPMFLSAHSPQHPGELRDWLERERPVAVGECGLDYFVDGLDQDAQLGFFRAQLKLARDFDLPLIIHARRAVDEVTSMIRQVGHLRGVVHSFSGSRQQAEKLWQQGFLLGLGGPVTYPRAKRLRRLAATMPLEWLLLETDSPDQPGAAHRGQRNEPAHVAEVLETIAGLRGVEAQRIAATTSANAERLFGLPATSDAL